MELNEECLQRACEAFDAATGRPRNAVAAAIEAYLAEMFKPDQMMTMEPLEAIPQRDYRKELWIAAYTNSQYAPASDAEKALAYFDATFPREKPHG